MACLLYAAAAAAAAVHLSLAGLGHGLISFDTVLATHVALRRIGPKTGLGSSIHNVHRGNLEHSVDVVIPLELSKRADVPFLVEVAQQQHQMRFTKFRSH